MVVVPDKNRNKNFGKPIETLIPYEPIHYHMLPPNERIYATNMGAQEKLNTNLATATTATTKQSVTLEKLQKPAEKKALN